ncbi:hypothetical protein KFK09_005537 [Dendrobium nobile]|uniref:DUF1664 domain-containing protein n=1 Tax=Dendrobium nobile TaxID=94219 RepID=A0A8T3BW34_DENNO|nr:hypothetical protein KFK09_005537 [Dendrobium nobile]
MAVGKIIIVIGAGIIGSVLSKEGGLSDATNFFSSALKIVTKHLQQDKDGSRSTPKPKTDTLLAQVSNLRKELQLLASSRSVTIVTSNRTGSRAYGVTIVVVVGCLGYGYAWWKGWKLSDMMFASRRGFSDACSSVGKQFEFVSSSITSAKRHLSSKIDVVDNGLDEMKELNAATKNEVMLLHGDTSLVHLDVESVTRAVRNLESKMDLIDDGQNFAGRGLYALCKLAEGCQLKMNKKTFQESASSSRQAIQQPQTLGASRTSSLPPLSLESPSPSSTESPKVLRPSITISAGGLKELQEVSNPIRLGNPRTSPRIPSKAANSPSEPNSGASSSGRSVWKLPGITALTRSWSNAG